jgi:GNAT superfamily N-acetyltransferase
VSTQQRRLISIVPSTPRRAEAMEDLMHAVYSSTRENPDGTFSAAMFRRQMQVFPDGQFTALEAGKVIGLTASMRIAFDPAHPFIEPWFTTISEGWLNRHDPAAAWMYGVESCVHPACQGAGVGGKLMEARFDVARELNLRGMVAGSDIMDYPKVAGQMTPEAYMQGVVEGKYWDNNLSKQLRKGFQALAVIPNYLTGIGQGWGVVIFWPNPAYDLARPVGTTLAKRRRYRITPRLHAAQRGS